MLNIQHRLNSEFSWLYSLFNEEAIFDHKTVENRPVLKGVASNIYFMDHQWEEQNCKDSFSKQNDLEVEFIVNFCKFLMKNLINGQKVTILSTYIGQVGELKKKIKKVNSDIRIQSVDHYPRPRE